MSDEQKVPMPFIITGRDLQKLKVKPLTWVVDGLLRTGRKRVSLLVGKPEDGKSTLARQLAVAVMQGKPFLGRDTMRGAGIYWQTEDEESDVKEAFARLGYDPNRDEQLIVFKGSPTENTLENLREVLTVVPDVRLVIVETLDDLLKVSDIKENSAARVAFDKFDTVVLKDFCEQAAFLGLHHMKKKEEDQSGDMIIGATIFRGRSDAKWYIRRVSDDDDRRIFFATVRTGRPMPKTYLSFDASTGSSAVGLTLEEDRKAHAVANEQRIKDDILKFFVTHPATTFERDCNPVVSGDSDTKRRVFKKLLAENVLVKDGKGTKGSPFTYRLAEVPMEGAA